MGGKTRNITFKTISTPVLMLIVDVPGRHVQKSSGVEIAFKAFSTPGLKGLGMLDISPLHAQKSSWSRLAFKVVTQQCCNTSCPFYGLIFIAITSVIKVDPLQSKCSPYVSLAIVNAATLHLTTQY